MNVYLVYVVFSNTYDTRSGYVGEWKKGCFPDIYPIGEEEHAQMFLSEKAAQAFADHLSAYYSEKLLHVELVAWQPSSK